MQDARTKDVAVVIFHEHNGRSLVDDAREKVGPILAVNAVVVQRLRFGGFCESR